MLLKLSCRPDFFYEENRHLVHEQAGGYRGENCHLKPFSLIGITCVATESAKEDEEWLWDTPLSAIANAKVPAKSLKA